MVRVRRNIKVWPEGNDMAEIGKHIRKIRKEKNLTQEELAERLHCTRQTISNYENGKSEPDIALLIEIAGALEVEINDLIYGPGKREGEKRQRDRAVAALTAAGVLMVAVKLLLPFAQEKSFKYFQVAPLFLLQYVLWPFALICLDGVWQRRERLSPESAYGKAERNGQNG